MKRLSIKTSIIMSVLFFLDDLPEDTDEASLTALLNYISPIESLQLLTQTYKGETYFLHSAYFKFKNSVASTNFIRHKDIFVYKDAPVTVLNSQKDDFYFYKLVVLGLRYDATSHNIMQHFAPFRPVSAKVYLSKNKLNAHAIVTFSRIRDRDVAVIQATPIYGCTFRLFPSDESKKEIIKPSTSSVSVRDPLPTICLPNDFTFIHQSNTYICNTFNVYQVCTRKFNDAKSCTLPQTQGDFTDIKDFIDGKPIEVTESNVCFLYTMGNYLGISAFTVLKPFSYLTMNNVIILANYMKEMTDVVPLTRFIENNIDVLNSTGRMRNLPVQIITQTLSSPTNTSIPIDPCQLLLQMKNPKENKTQLASLVHFRNCDIPELKLILADNQIDLNNFGEQFLAAYNDIANAPPYIVLEYAEGYPFNGIFHFLTEQYHMNPHMAHVVTLEASSTQVSTVYQILDYNSNDYFATRDVPGQWIKFEFNQHRVALTGYSYKTHSINGNGHTRTWKVHGSTDGLNWTLIHEMTNTNVLSNYGAVFIANFPLTQFYKVIKFTQTGTNTMNYNNFRVAHIEFFGQIQDDSSS